jgi:hypothetical protein
MVIANNDRICSDALMGKLSIWMNSGNVDMQKWRPHPLICAASNGHAHIVEVMSNDIGYYGHDVFLFAAMYGHRHILDTYCSDPSRHGSGILEGAIAGGQLPLLKWIRITWPAMISGWERSNILRKPMGKSVRPIMRKAMLEWFDSLGLTE